MTSAQIGGEEYSPDQNGINIIAIDNNYRRVVDVLTVVCEDGNLTLRR